MVLSKISRAYNLNHHAPMCRACSRHLVNEMTNVALVFAIALK